jgi:hypothetical protein
MTDSTDTSVVRQPGPPKTPVLLDESHRIGASDVRSKSAAATSGGDLSMNTAELFNSTTATLPSPETRGRAPAGSRANGRRKAAPESSEPKPVEPRPGEKEPAADRPPAFQGKPQRLKADQMDVQTGSVKVIKGDTLPSIAQDWAKNSGVDAKAYLSELTAFNHLKPGQKLPLGSELQMPGHTKDGAWVFENKWADQTIKYPDGRQVLLHDDSSGYSRTPTTDGGTETVSWGTRPESNYDMVKQSGGDYQVKDQGGKLQELYDNANAESHREKLSKLADSKIQDSDLLAKFHADMARFEQRANECHLGATEVAKTYEAVAKLLDSSLKTKWSVGKVERETLATQVMSQAATPTSIDQGNHDTCNVTAVEVRTYALHPSNAANLVADVALSGTYHTPFPQPKGTLIHLNSKSLIPDLEASDNPPKDGERSYATQVFNVTAVNLVHARDHTGEVFVNDPDGGDDVLYDRVAHKTVGSKPDLDDDQIVRAYDLINRTSRATEPTVLIDAAKNVAGDGKYCTVVNSEDELKVTLLEAKQHNQLPVILGVSSNVEPFWQDSGHGAAGGSLGMHVVSVTDVDIGPPATAKIDNQWGSKADHLGADGVPLDQLFIAMHKPTEAANLLQVSVNLDRAYGIFEPLDDLELSRLQHFNKMGDIKGTNHGERSKAQQEYASTLVGLIHKIRDSYADDAKEGYLSEDEKKKTIQKISSIIDDPNILAPAQAEVLATARDSGLIQPEDFDARIRDTMYDLAGADEPPEHPTDEEKNRYLFDKSQKPDGISKFTKLVAGLTAEEKRSIIDKDLDDDDVNSASKFKLLRTAHDIRLLNQNDFIQRAAKAIHTFRADQESHSFNSRSQKDEERRGIVEAKRLLNALPPDVREKIKAADKALSKNDGSASSKRASLDIYSDAPPPG